MSIKKPCETVTFITTGDLSAKQYHFVYQTADDKIVAAADAQNGATGNVFILQNAPIAGDVAECAIPGGQSLLKVDDAYAVGTGLMISSTNTGVLRAGANKYVRALVDEASTTANQLVVVNFVDPIFVTT